MPIIRLLKSQGQLQGPNPSSPPPVPKGPHYPIQSPSFCSQVTGHSFYLSQNIIFAHQEARGMELSSIFL
eukprot:scaffold3857_cov140-Skeletonema_menzelii.AAC.15